MLAQTYGLDIEQTVPLNVTSTSLSDEFNAAQNRRSRRDHLRARRAVAALRSEGRDNLDQLLAVRSINAANVDVGSVWNSLWWRILRGILFCPLV